MARSYDSDIKPDLTFRRYGRQDEIFLIRKIISSISLPVPDGFPPLRLPTVKDTACRSARLVRSRGCNATACLRVKKDFSGVTGNNVASWTPGMQDWYGDREIELRLGFHHAKLRLSTPLSAPDLPVPDTWKKMDCVIDYWRSMGVDGFRCDMAHMVPLEFWSWLIGNARARQPGVCFIGEAYDNDPCKIPSNSGNNVLLDLLNAGFDAVYDDPTHKILKSIYDGPCWANDCMDVTARNEVIFHHSLRYAENHDEVRLVSNGNWGDIGMEAGRAASAILYGLSRGPVMLYNGQEVGEQTAHDECRFRGRQRAHDHL